MTNLVRVFQFFRQIEKKILISQAFRLTYFANFEKKILVSKKDFKFAQTLFYVGMINISTIETLINVKKIPEIPT